MANWHQPCGVGGMAGGYTGARRQSRQLTDLVIRSLIGALVVATVSYLCPAWTGKIPWTAIAVIADSR